MDRGQVVTTLLRPSAGYRSPFVVWDRSPERAACARAQPLTIDGAGEFRVTSPTVGPHGGDRPVVRGGLAPWQRQRAIEHLRAHLGARISLERLACLVHLSRFHFARQFKVSTGLPPHAYLRRLRCEEARRLLETTNLPVTEIAFTVGYESSQALARMFRAEVGASPGEYRRERRAIQQLAARPTASGRVHAEPVSDAPLCPGSNRTC